MVYTINHRSCMDMVSLGSRYLGNFTPWTWSLGTIQRKPITKDLELGRVVL